MKIRLICSIIWGLWTIQMIASSSFYFRNLSVADGLPDLVINALYKDNSGYVWFGTNTSLERFDGVYLKHYMIKGSSENLKRVYAITEMPGKEIWVGTGNGLWRMNSRMHDLEHIASDIIEAPVKALLPDGKGVLYIGTEKGLYIYKNGNFKLLLLDKNVFSLKNYITGLSFGEQHLLWIATRKGVASLNLIDNSIAFYPYDRAFHSVCCIGKTLYLGTMSEGIIAFDISSRQYRRYIDVGCGVISSLSSDGKDLLYVGTDGNGVHFISTSQQQVVKSFRHEVGNENSIRSNSVYSLMLDRDGLLWIGYYQQGVDYTLFQSGLFETYKYPPYFDTKDMPIRTIAFHGDEKLIGTRDGLFYIDESRKIYRNYHSPELRASLILSSCYFEGNYYIGTYGGGMYVFNPETLTLSNFDSSEPNPFLNGHVFCIRSDNENNLWIGTSVGVYCYRDGKQVAHYTASNSKLPEGNVYEIYFDSTHKGWICTETGLCIWDPSSKSLKLDVFPEGFVDKEKIRSIYEDSEHNLYFLPEKGDLFVSTLNMSRFNRITVSLLKDKALMGIVEDDKKWLWITTNNGLYRYDKKETCIPYNFTDGIPSPIFINCFPVKDDTGGLWFGNSKGLVYLGTQGTNPLHNYPYRLSVSEILVNGKEFYPESRGNDIRLDRTASSLTFRFSGFTYTDPSNVSYEYMLEGENDSWKPLLGTSEVSFYNLQAGKYIFKMRRIGYPDSEAKLNIVVEGFPLLWIIGGGVLIILLGVVFYIRIRRRKQQPVVLADMRETVDVPEPAVVEQAVSSEIAKDIKTSEDKYKTNKVSPEECKRLFKLLEAVMQQKKPYKNPALKIADLADLIGTSSHVLSYLFNQYLNRNFYDYVNDYRVAEFKQLIAKEEYARYTLSALAEHCGFSSRASFFRHFKKMTGVTPNEYIKQLEK